MEERQTVEVVRSLEGQNCSTTPAMRKVSGGYDGGGGSGAETGEVSMTMKNEDSWHRRMALIATG